MGKSILWASKASMPEASPEYYLRASVLPQHFGKLMCGRLISVGDFGKYAPQNNKDTPHETERPTGS